MANIRTTQKEHFTSIKSFLETISSRKNNAVMAGKTSSVTGSADFTGTKNYQEAVDLMLNGWDKILPDIKKGFEAAIKSNENGAIDRRRTYNSVVGYAPHVPNSIIGLPQSMINQHREPQKVKVCSIVYAPDANAYTDANTFVKAGIVVLQIVNQLELNGQRVRLMLTPMDSFKNSTFVCCTIDVKSYHEQLDLKKLTFPIANASFLRRFGFKWLETYPELIESGFAAGYGRTISDEDDHKADLVKGGIIRDTDYFLSLGQIERLGFDVNKVMEKAGISK